MADKSNSSSEIVVGLLGILFIGLKLAGIITWSWWWVLLPFYGVAALIIAIALIVLFVWVLKLGIQETRRRRRVRQAGNTVLGDIAGRDIFKSINRRHIRR